MGVCVYQCYERAVVMDVNDNTSPLTWGVRRMLIMGQGDRRAKLAALSEPIRSA
jgi:hypothetical protein